MPGVLVSSAAALRSSAGLKQRQRRGLHAPCGEQQPPAARLGLDERILLLDPLQIPSGGDESEQMREGGPQAADAWLPVHRARLDGDAIQHEALLDVRWRPWDIGRRLRRRVRNRGYAEHPLPRIRNSDS